jgi:alpha-mannosidase
MFLMKERICKLIDSIKEMMYSSVYPVEEYEMLRSSAELKPEDLSEHGSWEKILARDIWGGHREFFYFRTTLQMPEACAGKRVTYELRTGKEGEWDAINPQFMLFINGERRMGLDVNHREVLLTESAKAGETFEILLQAYTGDNNFSLHLDSEFKVQEPAVVQYYYDLQVPYEVARLLREDSHDRQVILKSLNDSLNLVDLRQVYSPAFFESVQRADEFLQKEFYEKFCGNSTSTVYCVGHTHIDVAWLWTLRTTQDKAVRSFSTVIELMKEYPEYKFMSSQPQLYLYVKEKAPDLYEKIKERIAEGRWEAEGGMFLEADCNLSSGEALVRQFLYGTRFFEQEFGVKNQILWLPDVFGYSAALPQIMKKCGIRYFMTTKISWNEMNKMPYDTFMWEGIDGTEILTHFIPTRDYGMGAKEGSSETEHFTTYNGILNASQVMGGWQRYSQKELNDEVLMSYGHGDGGGGVTREMLETQRRLAKGIPGSPKTVPSTSLEFFKKLEENVAGRKELPRWVGELYLEYHRGTYTSMARNKKWNRRAEFACTNLEFYSVLAEKAGLTAYPQEEINQLWQILMRNQFHDILPGSSIKEVYDDSKEEYQQIFRETASLTGTALAGITEQIDAPKGSLIVYNPNSVSAEAPVMLPVGVTGDALRIGGTVIPVQHTEDGAVAVLSEVPSKGYCTYEILENAAALAAPMTITANRVETGCFIAELNEKGQFSRIYDKKAERELIPEGKCGNVIVSYEDRPHNFDAWDINNYYTEKSWEVDDVQDISVIENGPVRGCIRVERKYLDSTIVQYLYFYPELYRIDIRNEIDWNEKQLLLRAYLPMEIHSEDATYEIQYGNVKRPTHYNTSWDFAKFETCAHKWIDLSEDGYGVSVLNDCKYGCDIHNGVIGLSMLKSAVYPNPEADKEHHSFIWSICPHAEGWRQGETVAKAYLLNNPYQGVIKENEGGTLPQSSSFVRTNQQNYVIEAVKKAEDSDAMIVRLYECYNRRGTAVLEFAGPVRSAVICNMLEENENEEIRIDGCRVEFHMNPYEIKTIKVTV